MEKIKTYLVEVVMKNVGPKVASSVISMLLVFLAAHQDFMEKMGITYYPDFHGWLGNVPSGRLMVVEIDTLQVWGGVALIGLVTAVWALLQHHGVATVTGAPQSGDKRISSPTSLTGGERSTDPQAVQ